MGLCECPASNPLSRPGRDRAMSYPLDNLQKRGPHGSWQQNLVYISLGPLIILTGKPPALPGGI